MTHHTCETPGWQFLAESGFKPRLDSFEVSVRTSRFSNPGSWPKFESPPNHCSRPSCQPSYARNNPQFYLSCDNNEYTWKPSIPTTKTQPRGKCHHVIFHHHVRKTNDLLQIDDKFSSHSHSVVVNVMNVQLKARSTIGWCADISQLTFSSGAHR